MNNKPLPSVEKVVEIIGEYKHGRTALAWEMREKVTQDRDQAYTSLIEGIEGMRRKNISWEGTTDEQKNHLLAIFDAHNQLLSDIIEKVVKPLYGKE